MYAFAFAMWHWEKKALVDSRFTGRDGEEVGGQSQRVDTALGSPSLRAAEDIA